MHPFHLTATSALLREEVRRWAIGILGPDLAYANYRLESQAKREIVFTRTSRSVGTWLFTILLFPLGLIFFFAFKRRSIVTVLLQKGDHGTDIVVSGAAGARVIEGIAYPLSTDFADYDDDGTLEAS